MTFNGVIVPILVSMLEMVSVFPGALTDQVLNIDEGSNVGVTGLCSTVWTVQYLVPMTILVRSHNY